MKNSRPIERFRFGNALRNGLKAVWRNRQALSEAKLDDEFYKERARHIREFADKADPSSKRLLDLAGNYDLGAAVLAHSGLLAAERPASGYGDRYFRASAARRRSRGEGSGARLPEATRLPPS